MPEQLDPRRVKSRAAVLAAAVELLREAGLPGLTIEAVSARSGVAKTTIYRQFADREALHVAALESVAEVVHVPYTDDLVADLTKFCMGLMRVLQSSDLGALLPTALDGAERSPSLSAAMAEVSAERRAVMAERLRTAQRAGVLPEDADIDMINSQIVGPLFFRRFISRQPMGPAFVARHVQTVVSGLTARHAGDVPAGA